MKKIFTRGTDSDEGFVMIQTTFVIFIISILFAAFVEQINDELFLLNKKENVLKQNYEITEVLNESL